MLCQGEGYLVGRADQDGVQALLYGQRLSYVHGDAAAPGRIVEYGLLGEGDQFVHPAKLGGEQGGEDLGGAGRVFPLVDIFGIQDGAAVCLHEDGGFGGDHRPCRPVLDFVGINGHSALQLQSFFHGLVRTCP